MLRRRPPHPACDGRMCLHSPRQPRSPRVLSLPVPLVCGGRAPLQVVPQIRNEPLSLSLSLRGKGLIRKDAYQGLRDLWLRVPKCTQGTSASLDPPRYRAHQLRARTFLSPQGPAAPLPPPGAHLPSRMGLPRLPPISRAGHCFFPTARRDVRKATLRVDWAANEPL